MTMNTGAFPRSQRAAVIGGGMAGLLAAHVLAEHFEHVVLIDRDEFPTAPEPRVGVPQARHAHLLLTRGRKLLEEIFPGLTAELTAAGAWPVDVTKDFVLHNLGYAMPQVASQGQLQTLTLSRDLLEWAVRRRLNPKISFQTGYAVESLVHDAATSRVIGLRAVRNKPSADGQREALELPADLVVDASGRGSLAPRWLETLGYGAPRETVVNPFAGYATRWYQLSPRTSWHTLVVHERRTGTILRVEKDLGIVTLVGTGKDYPPTDEAGFLEFARSLSLPEFHETLLKSEPLSPIHGFRKTENRLRHYESLERWPEGFLVLGDAACTFNPAYGQGMTLSASTALRLKDCLKQQKRDASGIALKGLGQRFQRLLAKDFRLPWLMATSEDARVPEVTGAQVTAFSKVAQRYMDEVVALAAQRPEVYIAFFSVIHMVSPPERLFHPSILLRVLPRMFREKREG
ncbi:FAD-dependent oxidoreductase [Stigmatella erecta]|uniref:2-polyprenyl-6-methoxyphenol hydroxylase n=1 Tax=Stigmatella erecta TaxID=83460 RepID=A0A1I0L9R9_9BACT|nr:FAD-dependent monooxygenase [Stigmatella erecta]SEU36441.1 2-polyprenyl-6-methoxyphenol hydroxylase [Stigmatella erecta]